MALLLLLVWPLVLLTMQQLLPTGSWVRLRTRTVTVHGLHCLLLRLLLVQRLL